MYNHNKAQQSKNRVHISWDTLYVTALQIWVILFMGNKFWLRRQFAVGNQGFGIPNSKSLFAGCKPICWVQAYLLGAVQHVLSDTMAVLDRKLPAGPDTETTSCFKLSFHKYDGFDIEGHHFTSIITAFKQITM